MLRHEEMTVVAFERFAQLLDQRGGLRNELSRFCGLIYEVTLTTLLKTSVY